MGAAAGPGRIVADQHIVAVAAIEPVAADAAIERVVTGAADQGVVAADAERAGLAGQLDGVDLLVAGGLGMDAGAAHQIVGGVERQRQLPNLAVGHVIDAGPHRVIAPVHIQQIDLIDEAGLVGLEDAQATGVDGGIEGDQQPFGVVVAVIGRPGGAEIAVDIGVGGAGRLLGAVAAAGIGAAFGGGGGAGRPLGNDRAGPHRIIAADHVVAVAADQAVAAAAAGDGVVTPAADQFVGAKAADQGIAAGAADGILETGNGVALGIAAGHFVVAQIDEHAFRVAGVGQGVAVLVGKAEGQILGAAVGRRDGDVVEAVAVDVAGEADRGAGAGAAQHQAVCAVEHIRISVGGEQVDDPVGVAVGGIERRHATAAEQQIGRVGTGRADNHVGVAVAVEIAAAAYRNAGAVGAADDKAVGAFAIGQIGKADAAPAVIVMPGQVRAAEHHGGGAGIEIGRGIEGGAGGADDEVVVAVAVDVAGGADRPAEAFGTFKDGTVEAAAVAELVKVDQARVVVVQIIQMVAAVGDEGGAAVKIGRADQQIADAVAVDVAGAADRKTEVATFDIGVVGIEDVAVAAAVIDVEVVKVDPALAVGAQVFQVVAAKHREGGAAAPIVRGADQQVVDAVAIEVAGGADRKTKAAVIEIGAVGIEDVAIAAVAAVAAKDVKVDKAVSIAVQAGQPLCAAEGQENLAAVEVGGADQQVADTIVVNVAGAADRKTEAAALVAGVAGIEDVAVAVAAIGIGLVLVEIEKIDAPVAVGIAEAVKAGQVIAAEHHVGAAAKDIRGAEDQIVDTVAVDVASTADRVAAERGAGAGANAAREDEAVGAVERRQVDAGGGVAAQHVGAAAALDPVVAAAAFDGVVAVAAQKGVAAAGRHRRRQRVGGDDRGFDRVSRSDRIAQVTENIAGRGGVDDAAAIRRDAWQGFVRRPAIARQAGMIGADQGDFAGLQVLDVNLAIGAVGPRRQIGGAAAEGDVTAVRRYGRAEGVTVRLDAVHRFRNTGDFAGRQVLDEDVGFAVAVASDQIVGAAGEGDKLAIGGNLGAVGTTVGERTVSRRADQDHGASG